MGENGDQGRVLPGRGALPERHDVAEVIAGWNFESVWALLVDGEAGTPLPPGEEFPLPIHTGDHRVDMQSALAGLAPVWGLTSLLTTTPREARSCLARASVTALSFLAQSARGSDVPAVPSWVVDGVRGTARRFLTRWHGEADERFIRALDAGWNAVAINPHCPSVEVVRRTAATGADIAACLSAGVAASSGALASGGAARLTTLLEMRPSEERAQEFLESWGFVEGPEAEPGAALRSPRVQALSRVAREIGTDHERVTAHAHALTSYSHPRYSLERLLTTLWVTHLFTFVGAHPRMLTALFACGKTAGWSAVVLSEHTRLLENTTS